MHASLRMHYPNYSLTITDYYARKFLYRVKRNFNIYFLKYIKKESFPYKNLILINLRLKDRKTINYLF